LAAFTLGDGGHGGGVFPAVESCSHCGLSFLRCSVQRGLCGGVEGGADDVGGELGTAAASAWRSASRNATNASVVGAPVRTSLPSSTTQPAHSFPAQQSLAE